MTAIQELRLEYPLAMLLEIAQLPRATFYYHLKRSENPDKYDSAKEEITAIYHENKGRYGYRRITTELRKRNIPLNHKTVQRLMKEMGANGYRTTHYPQSAELMDALDENGFIVMNEVRWFESTEEGKAQLEMLMKRDRNRPSVFFWSIGNEEPHHATEQGRRIAE